MLEELDLQPSKRQRTDGLDLSSLTDMDFSQGSNDDELSFTTFNDPNEPPGLVEFFESPSSYRLNADFVNNTLLDDETLLTHSIKVQNVEAVEVLLLCGADPDQPNKKNITPISVAAHKGNVAIIQMLIDKHVLVNACNGSGSTALIQASHFGHLAAVNLLLRSHADADFSNNKGTTALMRGCQEGHVDVTRALLGANVDINKKNLEGMNALMLASQRGHAEIVFLLIRAGAVMDEQTAQGSTALMLACKRGHEKCAEVLVSMGAEIFMRDRRGRTARDTATKRNHTSLLVWLDTQVQVQRLQELKQKQRVNVLAELRQAHTHNNLRLCRGEAFVAELFQAVRIAQYYPLKDPSSSPTPPATIRKLKITAEMYDDAKQLIEDFLQSSRALTLVSKTPQDALQMMDDLVHHRQHAVLRALPVIRSPIVLTSLPAKRVPSYADWQWPSMLLRLMDMPQGVFHTIMDYMPLPRVWHWSLVRVQRRCRLAPTQAMQDLSVLMDEILCDTLVLGGADQRHTLTKLARSPHLHGYMLDEMGMPVHLLQSLIEWADVQVLLSRSVGVGGNGSGEVSFKHTMARRMLGVAVDLFKWHKQRISSVKWLSLLPPHVLAIEQRQLQFELHQQTIRDGVSSMQITTEEEENEDLVAGTDAGGEEGSDADLDLPAEPETETDFPAGAEGDDLLEDSDNDNGTA